MKTGKWIIEAQRKFTIFKKQEGLTGDCVNQNSNEIRYEEKWSLYPIKGGMPQTYYLQASKPHGTVHVRRVGDTCLISITEIDISGIPPIVSESNYRN